MKLNELKTAREIRKEEPWQVKFLYVLSWPKNQLEILWLKWETREGKT